MGHLSVPRAPAAKGNIARHDKGESFEIPVPGTSHRDGDPLADGELTRWTHERGRGSRAEMIVLEKRARVQMSRARVRNRRVLLPSYLNRESTSLYPACTKVHVQLHVL